MLTEKQAIQDVIECHRSLFELMEMLRAAVPGLVESEAIGELATLLDLYLAAVDGNLDMFKYAVDSLTHHLSKNSP